MGCLSGIAKYILFLFNLLIVACGIALIAVGVIILVNENKGVEGFTEFSIGGFAIAVGVIIFGIAFFGCCGAIKENSCMLTTYAVILVVLLILQIVLGALAFVAVRNDDNEIDEKVRDAITDVFEEYNSNSDKKKIVDDFQQYFECCGVDNATYWSPIPDSCYKDKTDRTTLFVKGCREAFQDFLTSIIHIIGGIAIGFAVVELIGAIFACVVRNR